MSRAPQRGGRVEIRLIMRDGAWTIYWGRALARELGCARRESTGTRDRPEAERILRVRMVEVTQRRGDQAGLDALRRTATAVPLDVLVSDFLRALAAGDLPGAKPRPSTLEGYMAHLLDARGGLVAFARSVDRATSDRLDRVLVERWLEAERGRAAPDTLRLKLIAARRLAAFAESRALMPPERLTAIRALRPPASARGRARVDGVPSEDEIRGLLAALSPARWRPVAELQLRLGGLRADVVPVTSWREFLASGGDPEAEDVEHGKRDSFRLNLSRVVDYGLKPWPAEHRARSLGRDVAASGVLAPVWAQVLRAGRAPPRPPPALLDGRSAPAVSRAPYTRPRSAPPARSPLSPLTT